MNAKDEIIDHKNNNRLDNRLENLRISTNSFNSHNVSKRKDTTSKYIGVSYNKSRNKYIGMIIKDKKSYYCGGFDTQEEAAKARDLKAIELYGNFAKLNL
jgi:hypothetical protein